VTNQNDRAGVHCMLLGMAPEALLFQRFAHPLRNHGRIVGESKHHGTLESLRACDQDAEATLEWVDRNPRFMRARRVSAASDHGRLDAFTTATGYPFDVEDG
jgi:hypothetical protein